MSSGPLWIFASWKKDKLQIVFGLLCTHEGISVAVEVFEGDTKDSKTVSAQIQKICMYTPLGN